MPILPFVREHDSNDDPFWIGDSLVEPKLCQITTDGRTPTIEQQVLRVLLVLVAHADEPVSRDTIIRRVWHNTVPNDEGLTQAISKLRKVLGDRPSEGNVIQTIRKVGYRLVAPIGHTRLRPLNFTMPLSITTRRQGNQSRRSVRIRVHGNWLAAAALMSITIFFVSQTF